MAIREINLIPPEILSRRYMHRHVYLWAGCLSLSMLLVIGFYFQQTGKAMTLTGTEAALGRAGSELSVQIQEIKKLQSELDALSREQTILDVVGGRHSYSQILLKLSVLLNESTWFKHITVTPDSKPGGPLALQIIGSSLSNGALGEFLNRLSFDPSFDDVVLKYSREQTPGGTRQEGGRPLTAIQFLIMCSAV